VAQLIEFPTTVDYTGKVLALNPEKTQKYQCGGFWLGPNQQVAIVPANAQHSQIHLAVLDGRLIEVSKDEIRTKNARLNPVQDLGETGFKTFLIVRMIDGAKVVSFLTPKDKAQEEEIESTIAAGQPIDFSKYPELERKKEIAPYLSGIIITDLEPETTE
jgi:hypothetical protein